MKEVTPAELLGQLREEIELVAAGPPDQERWLIEHRLPVDEIALQLNDSVLTFLPRLRREGLMPARLEAALRELDDHFGSFSGRENAARWSDEALSGDPMWAQARRQAQAILGLIDAVTGSS
ncbi:MAG: hypothetical protein ACLQFR_24500 [Streptosporangiaceae bacterium]